VFISENVLHNSFGVGSADDPQSLFDYNGARMGLKPKGFEAGVVLQMERNSRADIPKLRWVKIRKTESKV